jgi:hypothetical protein
MWNVPGKPYEEAVRRESLMLAEHPEALSVVIWDSESDQPLAVGTSVFVHEKFYKECVASPMPWVVSRAWDQQQAGHSPFLDHQQIRHCFAEDPKGRVFRGSVERERVNTRRHFRDLSESALMPRDRQDSRALSRRVSHDLAPDTSARAEHDHTLTLKQSILREHT